MRKKLLNIFRRNPKVLQDRQLMDYLSGKLSSTARHEVESWIADQQDFGNDALEGLQSLSGRKTLQSHLSKMNSDLNRMIKVQQKTRKAKKQPEFKWIYLSIVLILLLAICGYLIISKLYGS